MKRKGVILEFMKELAETQDLDSIKYRLLAMAAGKKHLIDFLNTAFALEEARRPLLIDARKSAP